jgi:phage gp36-like protein
MSHFLTEEDYRLLIQAEDRDIVEQSDAGLRQKAENTAIEEMKGYFRSRYDVDSIFSPDQEPDARNAVIVLFCMDITLYHLHSSVPTRLIPELRVKRYDDAVRWLDKVQVGKVNPGLPLISELDPGAPIRFNSNEKMINDW